MDEFIVWNRWWL